MHRLQFVRAEDGRYINVGAVREFWLLAPEQEGDHWELMATLFEDYAQDASFPYESLSQHCCELHAQAYLDEMMGQVGVATQHHEPQKAAIPKESN